MAKFNSPKDKRQFKQFLGGYINDLVAGGMSVADAEKDAASKFAYTDTWKKAAERAGLSVKGKPISAPVPKMGALRMLGRVATPLFLGMTAYDLARSMGAFGVRGEKDAATAAALEGSIFPSMQRQTQMGQGVAGMERETDQLQRLLGFAEEEQRGKRRINRMMSAELDSIVGAKKGMVAQSAALNKRDNQDILADLAAQGII